MKVLYVATSYPDSDIDWKSVFIRKLAFALSSTDEVSLKMWTPPGPMPEQAESVASTSELNWLAKLMKKGGVAHVMRTRTFTSLMTPFKLIYFLHRVYKREQSTDLYHLNWLQTAIPLPANGKPVLITVLGSDLKLMRLPMIKTLLRRVMRGRSVAICPNADWMVAPLKHSFGDLAAVKEVAFGIDPAWFKLQRNLNTDKPRWITVTRLTRDKLGPLLEWSAPLFRDQSRELHLIGPMQERIDLPDWINYHGPASAEELEKNWFPNAHGLITLSEHAEGRPQVMLEAMAAGLPIIASKMPAHISLVKHEETGMICTSASEFEGAINLLENKDRNLKFGETGRVTIEREVGTWSDCAERFRATYHQLMRKQLY